MTAADPALILDWIRRLHPPGALVEARCLRKTAGNLTGLYTDHHQLAQDLARRDGTGNLYTTLQEIREDLVLYSGERPQPRNTLSPAGSATRDIDIVRYRWLFIDADPIRIPVDRVATDAEHAAAVAYVSRIAATLAAEGWTDPVLAGSGNGAYALYLVDLPVTDADLVRRTLEGIKRRFPDPAVKVDTSMYNPARIIRVVGTTNMKGSVAPGAVRRPTRVLEATNGRP